MISGDAFECTISPSAEICEASGRVRNGLAFSLSERIYEVPHGIDVH